ncbi:MAG: ATP-binding cassette domain-containing protein [Rickettsiales bacterium]|jgi:Fe-S cluster assembly ATP-binding protein|nr:ATP-binding cassette domain-containing protein [Rickettsiales bacterium]
MNNILEIKNLTVRSGGKILLDNVNLAVSAGCRHLLVGANGSGKTTLAQTIAGNPEYEIDGGRIIFDGADATGESATRRALMGIFTAAQIVPEIPGLTITSFLKHSAAAHHQFQTGKLLNTAEFMDRLESARARLGIPREWLGRSVNVGFSGGERKKIAFLRLLMMQPKLAILDEPDSGADAAAQKLFAEIINEMGGTTFLIISHQDKFRELIRPTGITTLSDGRVVV